MALGSTNEQSRSRRPTSKHGLGGVGQVVEMGREQFEVLAAPFGRRKQALISQLGRNSSLAALALPLLMSYLLVQGVREVWRRCLPGSELLHARLRS